MSIRFIAALLCCCTVTAPAFAGPPAASPSHLNLDLNDPPPPSAPSLPGDTTVVHEHDADPLVIGLATAGITVATMTTVTVAWWGDKHFESFKFYDAGFFGKETYAGGGDKAGHLYAAYLGTRVVRPIYQSLGLSKNHSILYSAILNGVVMNGFEVVDGFTGYGVELGDMLMNSIGVGLGALTEASPTVDSILGIRIGYVPSRDFLDNERTVLKFLNDYTGMAYYVDLKLKGVFETLDVDPGPFRFLMVGGVFTASKYSPVRVMEERRRAIGAHVSISLPEVLRAFGDGDEGVEGIATFFDFYAVPLLTVAIMHDLNAGTSYLNFGVPNSLEADL